MKLHKVLYGMKEIISVSDTSGGFEAYIQKDKVILTTYTKGESGRSETAIEIPRNLWNSLAGKSLRMVRE
ncbi:hypothetical protein M3611_26630 [Priestia megaterium]|jgi:hypothetical protein|uniref:hypothetical protein n=1 Tax=Priestia megaterium TaxID=1404 RepID=UPI002040464E|nr:hypothetical protein [Priestia megaterium]MCM3155571.1 hypothetical protein [Priestia megaterium]